MHDEKNEIPCVQAKSQDPNRFKKYMSIKIKKNRKSPARSATYFNVGVIVNKWVVKKNKNGVKDQKEPNNTLLSVRKLNNKKLRNVTFDLSENILFFVGKDLNAV